jgi:hypothetical protein
MRERERRRKVVVHFSLKFDDLLAFADRTRRVIELRTNHEQRIAIAKSEIFREIARHQKYPIEFRREAVLAGDGWSVGRDCAQPMRPRVEPRLSSSSSDAESFSLDESMHAGTR